MPILSFPMCRYRPPWGIDKMNLLPSRTAPRYVYLYRYLAISFDNSLCLSINIALFCMSIDKHTSLLYVSFHHYSLFLQVSVSRDRAHSSVEIGLLSIETGLLGICIHQSRSFLQVCIHRCRCLLRVLIHKCLDPQYLHFYSPV